MCNLVGEGALFRPQRGEGQETWVHLGTRKYPVWTLSGDQVLDIVNVSGDESESNTDTGWDCHCPGSGRFTPQEWERKERRDIRKSEGRMSKNEGRDTPSLFAEDNG